MAKKPMVYVVYIHNVLSHWSIGRGISKTLPQYISARNAHLESDIVYSRNTTIKT